MRRTALFGPAAGLTAALALLPPGQAAAQYELDWKVNGAGGDVVTNGTITLGCTIGQAAIGLTASATQTHGIGFWYGMEGGFSDVTEPPSTLPTSFALNLAGANPAGSLSRIAYAVPTPAHVTIRLFDITGREVRTLVAGRVEPGNHETDLGAAGLNGGIYFCRMEAGAFSATRKLVLLR